MRSPLVATGTVLGERYTLRKSDWSSPLGPVWLARDRVLDRPVLVQLLWEELAADHDARRTFLKTSSRMAQLSHPALLRVYDIGDDPPFVVFEHAAGGRLADRLRAGPLRPAEAARAALSLARGLETLHGHGEWHGALSPAAVLLDEEGRPKVLASGAAEVARAHPIDVQQPGSYRPRDPDPVPADADRYALAALTAEMISGRPPERGEPSRGARAGIPREIQRLLASALSDDAARRPSLDSFIGALAPLARVAPPEARAPRVRAREFSWLAPVAVIILLAAAAVYVGLNVDFSRDVPQPSPTPAAPRPIGIEDVEVFDPPPGDNRENNRQLRRATDGDPRTAWETEGYRTAPLSNRKPGVGLLFDLGSSVRVGRLRVQSTREGWTAEVRVADERGRSVDDFEAVARFTAATDQQVALPPGTRARYVLLWITSLVDDESGGPHPFRAAVAEVDVFG